MKFDAKNLDEKQLDRLIEKLIRQRKSGQGVKGRSGGLSGQKAAGKSGPVNTARLKSGITKALKKGNE